MFHNWRHLAILHFFQSRPSKQHPNNRQNWVDSKRHNCQLIPEPQIGSWNKMVTSMFCCFMGSTKLIMCPFMVDWDIVDVSWGRKSFSTNWYKLSSCVSCQGAPWREKTLSQESGLSFKWIRTGRDCYEESPWKKQNTKEEQLKWNMFGQYPGMPACGNCSVQKAIEKWKGWEILKAKVLRHACFKLYHWYRYGGRPNC